MKRLLICVSDIIFFVFVAFSGESRSIEELVDPHLKIIWKASKLKKSFLESDTEPRVQFISVCSNLGKAMLAGNGPWGMGVFTTFSCHINNDLVAGEDNGGPFKLEIRSIEKGLFLDLIMEQPRDGNDLVPISKRFAPRLWAKNNMISLARIKLPPSEWALEALDDDELTDLLALYLLDSAPMGFSFSKNSAAKIKLYQGRTFRFNGSEENVPPPPGEVTFYRLRFDSISRLWIGDLAGKAKLHKWQAMSDEMIQARPKKKRKVLVGAIWSLDEEAISAIEKGDVFGQNSRGRGSRGGEIKKLIENKYGAVLATVLQEKRDEK